MGAAGLAASRGGRGRTGARSATARTRRETCAASQDCTAPERRAPARRRRSVTHPSGRHRKRVRTRRSSQGSTANAYRPDRLYRLVQRRAGVGQDVRAALQRRVVHDGPAGEEHRAANRQRRIVRVPAIAAGLRGRCRLSGGAAARLQAQPPFAGVRRRPVPQMPPLAPTLRPGCAPQVRARPGRRAGAPVASARSRASRSPTW
jgi:hypothetical protein